MRRVAWIGMAMLAGCAGTPHPAPLGLTAQVRGAFADPALAGARIGLFVTDDAGREVAALSPDERFVPASTAKLATTAAALAAPSLPAVGTGIAVERDPAGGPPDIALIGHGDAALDDRAGCARDCLATLADAVAGAGIRRVRDVIGDDTAFADERWGPGWGWDDLVTGSGAAASALTLDDNVAALDVIPGVAGGLATIRWADGEDYFLVRDDVTTVVTGDTAIRVDRLPGSRIVRLSGQIAAAAPPRHLVVGVEDPAAFAAAHLRRLLEARGVAVAGRALARHRPPGASDGGATVEPVLASVEGVPLAEDLNTTLKHSQNLHAELLLRRLGGGSRERGLDVVAATLAQAGVPRAAFDLADGSGMSPHDRITPRALVTLLRWSIAQPWGAAWRADLPLGGVDGTLARRFRVTPLERRVQAKTGTLTGVNTLAGFLTAVSGRTLVFAILVNDQPTVAGAGTAAIDAALARIAAAN